MTGFATKAIHGREKREKPYHSLITPICPSSTFTFEDMEDVERAQDEYLRGKYLERQEYGRYGNPTQYAVEARLASLEGAEAAILSASGMYAVTATLLGLLSQGDHMILTMDCYRRTRGFCSTYLPRWGIETTIVPPCDIAAIEENVDEEPLDPFLGRPADQRMELILVGVDIAVGEQPDEMYLAALCCAFNNNAGSVFRDK